MEEKNEFEKNEKRLNEICEKMESENLNISDAANLFEEGAGLIMKCVTELDNIKGKIVKIEESLNGDIEETNFN